MKQLANGCTLLLSPAFYTPEEGRTNRADFYSDCVACGEPLAATNAIGVYMLPCGHKYHSMCFATTLVSKQVCVQLGCNERITETVKSMLVGHNPRASPYFQEPTVSDVKTEVSGITNKLAYVELLIVVSYSFHHFAGWSDEEAAHHTSFETGRGYTGNAVAVEEGNVSDLGIASPGGAEKSWSDREAAKNVGHDTVPPESIELGATSEVGVEAVLGGDTDPESLFLAEFVKKFKSNKRTTTTTAPGEGKICYQLANLAFLETCESSNFNWFAMQMQAHQRKQDLLRRKMLVFIYKLTVVLCLHLTRTMPIQNHVLARSCNFLDVCLYFCPWFTSFLL